MAGSEWAHALGATHLSFLFAMTHHQLHRGRHPKDHESFRAEALPVLRAAVADFGWLLSRGYAENSALKLVGDRYALVARQRMAVLRSAAPEAACRARRLKQVGSQQLAGEPLYVDGYNVLITVESALAGGVLLGGADGAIRDLASLHGNYRKVAETLPAINLVGQFLQTLRLARVIWQLDAPVSNSGRLARLLRQTAEQHGWPWQAEAVPDPDPLLAEAPAAVASSDSWVLDHCGHWFNLVRALLEVHLPRADVLWLGSDQAAPNGSS